MTQIPADYLSTTSSYNYEQPLTSVARTSTVTKVLPAKKITFFKSGDPQFAGVKMAINQRSFKSFNALMDDLSHRVPLPFGVRTITTPRGIHCISELDQLEDGGCYLCSDKKYVKPISITSGGHRPGPPRNGRPSSTLRRAAQEGKLEDYSTPFTQHGPRIPKKITLVKNGESGFRRSIILNRRNARSFKTLLDEISEILQFPVKKLYTVDGKKIDNMQALLHCPSVLVCVGREPFKPVLMENLRKHSVEKLPNLAPRSNGNNVKENNEMDFGLKAKKSVIHPRTASSNRSMRFSLSSEKSYPNGLAASPDNGVPFSNSCSHSKPGDLVHSLVNDDIEKRVHVNKDGSLSVEMKVRFRLLNDETLQWSTQIKKSNLMNQMPCEVSGVGEDNGVHPIEKMNPEASSEADESLYPCDIDSYMSKLEESECDEAHCHSCGKKHQDYDIWKNPMHTSQRGEPNVRSSWHTRSSCSSTSSRRRVVHKKMASVDSLRTTSSEEFSEHIVQESSSYSETIENRVAYQSIKKCMCRSDLSTGASNGEDQQEYTRTSTSNSQRPSSLGLMSHSSCENNLDTQETPEDHEASKINSQNEDETCFEVSSVKCLKDDGEEVESSRVGSAMSKSSLQSRKSKNVCDETSSVDRSMSSSSLQKANQDNNSRSSTPANSVHSKSSNCTAPRAKSEQDDHSDDNAVISSFSSESNPKKEAEEVEAEQEENEINEVSSVSAKSKPSQLIRDESSEDERCSTQGTPHSRASGRDSKRSDSEEVNLCNASCSSRGSKKSKHRHIHLDTQSEMSVSSLESTLNKKKNTLHADDLRSCSRTSNYSKSSCEIKKKSVGDPMSQKSGSFHSNISSVSETEANAGFMEEKSLKSTTNGYSESSKGSKKRSHREENSKSSSVCSSVSSPNEKAREGNFKINSEATSSRQGSMSESVCSKFDHLTETGIKNGNTASVSSRVSSKSEIKDKCLLAHISQESDDRCSQSNVSKYSKSRQIKTGNLHVEMSNSSQASLPDTVSVCSIHCPAPPKGKPNSKKLRSTMFKNFSISSIGTASVMTPRKEQKEIVDSSKATSYGSKSAAAEIDDEKSKQIDGSCNKKVEEELEGMDMQEEGNELVPSTLPNTSPEEVVQEWLSKIPSETLLMKYEMEDNVEEECMEATTEVSYCTNAEEISEDEKAEEKEEAENEAKDEVGKEAAEGTAINEEAEECVNQEKISEVVSEADKADQAECSQSATSQQNSNRRDLPTTVQTSVQIMKALLSSKHETKFDRSNSLPEVSPTMGRKLSNSASILITCLASLQLLDEESEGPSDKSKCLNKPRYMELLNVFQALWFGCIPEKSGPSSDQEACEQAKTASGFKAPKSVDYDFTPMSSSGVDVNSGSGGSVEENTGGVRDCTSAAQKTAEFKSSGQVENVETGTELTEAEEQNKKEEQSSRPSTACSKSKAEEKAQSTREISLIQEAEENKEDQCSNCEHGQEEEGEDEDKKTIKLTENGEQEEAEVVNYELPKENLEEEADHLAATDDTNVNDADCGTELKDDLEEQLEKESPNDPEPKVDTATSVGTSFVQQNSMDPDPVWVLKLLKKIEKEFMAHYVSAMNEFKVRWNLQDNQQMDEIILELKEEVSKRIQKSIEKELRKIKTRAGQKLPRPPDEPLRRESTLQTEQRRLRLQTMHKKSHFSDKNGNQPRLEDTSDLSFDVDKDIALSEAFEASISKQTSEEEYCPCDSCVRKQMASKPTRNPVVATNAPVMKAFDLQQILKLKKNYNEEACVSEAAQDNKTTPSTSVEESTENGNPNEENDEGETEVEGTEEKEPELNETGSSVLSGCEGSEISENQNCEVENEVKDEETNEEEKKEAEVVEEAEEREEEEAKEEREEEEEEEIMNVEEEEETKEEEEGETKEKEDEEVKEEGAEETMEEEEINEEKEKEEEAGVKEEEEEIKEEEEEEIKGEEDMNEEEETKKEEEEEIKEEDEDMKEEEEAKEEEEEEAKEEEEEEANEEGEEGKEEEEETKEEEDMKEKEEAKEKAEEETKEEGEEVKEEEEETKEEEEDMKEEEEETKEEGEEVKEEEEETKEEEEDMKEEEEAKEEEEEEEEEVSKEHDEAKEEEESKQEEQEVEEEVENPKEEEEEEAKEEEDEFNGEEEEQKETQNEEQEAEAEADDAEEEEDEDTGADNEEETSECRGDADCSGTVNSPEGDAAEGSEKAEQHEAEAEEVANPESDEMCSDKEENNSEGDEKYDENFEKPTSDNPDKAHEKHEVKGVKGNKVSEKALKAKERKSNKRLGTLNKAAAFSCYSSVGNFSQQSQKGSEDEDEEECKDDNNSMSNLPNGEVQSDESSKPSQMYPDSEEEEDKASSCTDPLEDEDQVDIEGTDSKEVEHTEKVQVSKKKEDSNEIGQDDLDF